MGVVARNVAMLVDAPGPGQQEMLFLSPEEARSFLEAIRGDRLEVLYTVALALGLRPGEALGLRWQDVDLEAGILRVQVSLQRIDGKLVVDELKTRRSRRSLALPHFAITALEAHQTRQDVERQAAGARWEEQGLVFSTQLGRPLGQRNIIRCFRRTLKKAGIAHRRFYDLRLAALGARGASTRRDGDPRPQSDQHHDEYLQPRRASTPTGRRSAHEQPVSR